MSKNQKEKLKEHRDSIDRLDTVIIYTLGERFDQTNKIGKIKAKSNLPSSDYDRESYQIKRIRKTARDANLDPVLHCLASKLIDSQGILLVLDNIFLPR